MQTLDLNAIDREIQQAKGEKTELVARVQLDGVWYLFWVLFYRENNAIIGRLYYHAQGLAFAYCEFASYYEPEEGILKESENVELHARWLSAKNTGNLPYKVRELCSSETVVIYRFESDKTQEGNEAAAANEMQKVLAGLEQLFQNIATPRTCETCLDNAIKSIQ